MGSNATLEANFAGGKSKIQFNPVASKRHCFFLYKNWILSWEKWDHGMQINKHANRQKEPSWKMGLLRWSRTREGNELTSSSGAAYRPCRASELDLVVDVKLRNKQTHVTSHQRKGRAAWPELSGEAHGTLQFRLLTKKSPVSISHFTPKPTDQFYSWCLFT